MTTTKNKRVEGVACPKQGKKKVVKFTWVKAIPESTAHGSGTYQKRLWRLVSDYVRIRDWERFGGLCVATGVKLDHWKDGQAGHLKSYAVCNGLFKFDPVNIHLQSASSNGWGGMQAGHSFGEELKKRYGKNILDYINSENLKHLSEKLDDHTVIGFMADILIRFEELDEKPDYYARVINLKQSNV